MTEKNKLLGGALALLIAAQFCFGIFSVIWISLHPRKFLDHLFFRMRTHRLLVQPLPPVDLHALKFCAFKWWRLGALIHSNLSIFFGTSSPPNLPHSFAREF